MKHAQRFTLEKIKRRLELIEPTVYTAHHLLPVFKYREIDSPERTILVEKDFDDSQWEVIPPHSYWGRRRTNFVLRTTFAIPKDWDPALPTALFLPLGDAGDFSHPESLVYIDGAPFAACDRHHQEILLPERYLDGLDHTLALHGWTGLGGPVHDERQTKLYMHPCELVQIHEIARTFIVSARIALETAKNLPEDDPVHGRLLNALNDTFNVLDTREPLQERYYKSLQPAAEALSLGLEAAGTPMDLTVHAAGHAHIDVAWLWTLGQTRQKAARTFHTVLRYMEDRKSVV